MGSLSVQYWRLITLREARSHGLYEFDVGNCQYNFCANAQDRLDIESDWNGGDQEVRLLPKSVTL